MKTKPQTHETRSGTGPSGNPAASPPGHRCRLSFVWRFLAGLLLAVPGGQSAESARPAPNPAPAGAAAPAGSRADGLRRVCQRLGIGTGASIADVGAGNGGDTFVFADIAGPTGRVYSEEITEALRAGLERKARERGLGQVTAVLGTSADPCLPDGALDLVYMHSVFHHFADPHAMLAQFRKDLKPGGFLAIVDREKGPQRDWPDLASREKKHFWTGETTVVRMAREAGFQFEDVLDDLWPDAKPFVLVFRNPSGDPAAKGDPDLPAVFDGAAAAARLPPLPADRPVVLFVGLDRGRALLDPLRTAANAGWRLLDTIPEEWITVREERPPDAASRGEDGRIASVRMAKGDLPALTNRIVHAAVFADGYSRLWDPAPLLRRVRGSMPDDGFVAVLDRAGPSGEARRLAGHRRRIAPTLVKDDMKRAGFDFVRELEPPAPDRFFLLFRPKRERDRAP